MNRTRSLKPDIQDDSINIAGWVFADLLLSLSIIFLVSISFTIPEKIGDVLNVDNSSSQIKNLENNSLGNAAPLSEGSNFYYSEFSKEKIEKDLESYFLSKALDLRSEVIYAQIVGGFDPALEGSDLGTMRALEFSIALKRANVAAFQKANYDLTTSGALKPNQVALRLTFIAPISGLREKLLNLK